MRGAAKRLVGAALALVLAGACYAIWTGSQVWLKKTVPGDFRMGLAVVLIFLFLSVAEIVLQRLWPPAGDKDIDSGD